MKFALPATLTTLLVVTLIQSPCLGLERNAHDYLIPLLKTKGLDPAEIQQDVQWLAENFEAAGKKSDAIRSYLLSLRDKLKSGLQTLPGSIGGSGLEFAVLTNDDFKESASSLRVGGRSHVIIDVIDSIISILNGAISKFENWLTVSAVFYSLHGIPQDNAMTIHEAGIRFGPKGSDAPRSNFYHYIKYLTEVYLAVYLRELEISPGSIEESKIDAIFANKDGRSSLTDEQLWRAAFKGEVMERNESTESIDSTKLSEKLRKWTHDADFKIDFRKSLEKSAGIITIAMALAPEELRKFKGLNFALMKQVEYFRLLNQGSYCYNCFFLGQ